MKGRRSVKAKNRMYKTGAMGLLVKSSLSGAFFLSLLFFNSFCFSLAEVKKQVPSVEEGEVLRPLLKCYTGIEVSSNKGDVSR